MKLRNFIKENADDTTVIYDEIDGITAISNLNLTLLTCYKQSVFRTGAHLGGEGGYIPCPQKEKCL